MAEPETNSAPGSPGSDRSMSTAKAMAETEARVRPYREAVNSDTA